MKELQAEEEQSRRAEERQRLLDLCVALWRCTCSVPARSYSRNHEEYILKLKKAKNERIETLLRQVSGFVALAP